MIWAALALMLALVVLPALAWYGSRRQLTATSETQHRRLLRQAAFFSGGVGVAILVMGAVAFVITSYNWFVLALTWSFGLLHLGLLARALRRARERAGRAGSAR